MLLKILKTVLSVTVAFCAVSARADRIALLENDRLALQARVSLIKSARHEILVEYYEADGDRVGLGGLALLREAAARGVKVKLLLDSLHNRFERSQLAAALGPNFEIRGFNPLHKLNPMSLTYRNHDKLLNVDGQQMIVGGRNVSEHYFGYAEKDNFRDLDLLVEGRSAAEAREYFLKLWDHNPEVQNIDMLDFAADNLNSPCWAGERDACERQRQQNQAQVQKADGQMKQLLEAINAGRGWVSQVAPLDFFHEGIDVETVRFFSNDPLKSMEEVEVRVEDQISGLLLEQAKESIVIETPYFYPTEKLLQTLETQGRRGVKIKILTNSLASTNVPLSYVALLTIKKRLTSMGAEIYLYKGPEILHGKAAIIDGKTTMVGSFNFDRRSARLNREMGVILSGKNSERFAGLLGESFQRIMADSVLINQDGQEMDLGELEKSAPAAKRSNIYKQKMLLMLLKDQI
jgi:putative cardiolipin synthase